MNSAEPDYSAIRPIYDRMQSETLGGVPLSDVVGGGADPLAIAQHFVDLLVSEARLKSDSRVLDIGCGCGRIAAAMTQSIDERGSYTGVDIVDGLVAFARRNITAAWPHFRFLTLDQPNQSYDYFRGADAGASIPDLELACDAGAMDIVMATSLFTHLSAADARINFRAVSRALKHDGRGFLTMFLLDPGTRAVMRQGVPTFSFAHALSPGMFTERQDEPSYAVAMELDTLLALLAEAGLYVERILYGAWPGRPHYVSFQDVLVVRKMAQRPAA